MEKTHDRDSHIIYVDPKGVAHAALVTIWWKKGHCSTEQSEPGCNLIYVTGDESKKDPYGHQIERATSVVHRSYQPAAGNYWKWPDEV